jgi:hypothetical protein
MSHEITPGNTRRRVRLLSKRLLLFLASVFVALLIVEVFLRVIGFTNLNPYTVDKDVGFSLRPRAEGWWRGEGITYIKINSDGLRDREHTKAKPPETLRIAVLGDSFTEASDVEMNDAWWAVMEQRLAGCNALAGRKIEVINFGVSGFSTARELITLRTRVWQYAPDVIVLNFTTINDIKDNSEALNKEYSTPLPYFVYKGNELVLDDTLLKARNSSVYFRLQQSSLGNIMDVMRDHLRIMTLVDKARIAYARRKVIAQKTESQAEAATKVKGWDPNVYVSPKDPDWIEAWRTTEGILLLMRDEVRTRNAKFLVVTGTGGIQVWPDPAVRQKAMNDLQVTDFFYPDFRIKALGEREGFAVLNLAPTMQQYADQHRIFLHGQRELIGYGHWNQAGHRIAGELVADKLCAEVIPQK